MDDESKKKQKTALVIALVVVGLVAAVASGVKFLTPEKEQVIGSLDGPGGGGKGMRDAEAGTADPAARPEGTAPPAGVEGGRGQ
jgi:hypothetical protein